MDCCGHGHVAAPQVWSKPLVSVGAMLAGEVGPHGSTAAAQTAETTAAALAVLRNTISVDVHSHRGSTGITSKAPPSGDIANAMRAGSLAVAYLADVPDWPVLGRSPGGPSLRCERRHQASSTSTTSAALAVPSLRKPLPSSAESAANLDPPRMRQMLNVDRRHYWINKA